MTYLLVPRTARLQITDKEPIAYTGHGAMFDQKGKEIAPTLKFIREAQAWYEADLTKKLSKSQQTQFARLKQDMAKNLALDQQSQLVLNSSLLDWLIDRTNIKDAKRLNSLRAKNNVIKGYLRNPLSNDPDIKRRRSPEKFKVNTKLIERLKTSTQLKISKNLLSSTLWDKELFSYPILPSARPNQAEGLFWKTGFNINSYTAISPDTADTAGAGPAPEVATAGGASYRATCQAAGVPLPPDFGPGTPWVDQGEIPTADLFILSGLGARVLTYTAHLPKGCVSLCRAMIRVTIPSISME
jgi:hypothetical protein